MEAARLYELMANPSLLNKESLAELQQIIGDYPYFQAARMLYLKNLSELQDIHYTSELKKTAVYLPDRKKLFMFIEGSQFDLQVETKPETEEIPDDSFTLIDTFLTSHSELSGLAASDPSILFRPSASTDYLYWATSKQPADEADDSNAPQLQHHELIDSFLEDDKDRMPGQGLRFEDEAYSLNYMEEMEKKKEPQQLEGDSYFTETLARIYIKQRRYDKALQIIKNLSLKYPEKNVYFADQIRFLEKLIINTKKQE